MNQRRCHARYRPAGSAFVLFETNNRNRFMKAGMIQVGPVSEISRNGLSVEYEPESLHDKSFHRLSILVPGQGVVIHQLPFETVSDIILTPQDQKIKMRRRGIRFSELMKPHSEQLDQFLRMYTRGPLPDRRSGCERRFDSAFQEGLTGDIEKQSHVGRRSGTDRRGRLAEAAVVNRT